MVLLNKLLQLAVLFALVVLVALLWRPAPVLASALGGLGGLMLLLMVLTQRRRTLSAGAAAGAPLTPEQEERQARFVVTQLLGELTRAQVAYLRQNFKDGAEGRSWLKRLLPRTYRSALDQIHQDLEAARGGNAPESLRLVERVLELNERRLSKAEATLAALSKKHPESALAQPVAFVVTERIEIDRDDSEPELFLVAGWTPSKPTLLPAVDMVTVFEVDANGKRKAQGQIAFPALVAHLGVRGGKGNVKEKGGRLRLVSSASGPKIYACDALEEDLDELLEPLPLGFIVGASELT